MTATNSNPGPEHADARAPSPEGLAADAPAIELVDIVKTYPGVRALDGVSFDAARGEIHAVVGENGAGKSTLMKIMMGVTAPDSGEMLIEGEEARPRSPREARKKYGIKMIPQELELCRQMPVGRNVLLGLEGPLVRRNKLSEKERARIDDAFRLIDARVDPRRPSHELSVPRRDLLRSPTRCSRAATSSCVMSQPPCCPRWTPRRSSTASSGCAPRRA